MIFWGGRSICLMTPSQETQKEMQYTSHRTADRVQIGEKYYLTLKKFSADLGITQETARDWLDRYGLPGIQIGHMVIFDEAEVQEWLDNRKPRLGRPRGARSLWSLGHD